MIYDQDGSFIWKTDDLDTWIEADITYLAPFFTQTAGGNPLIILDDAPLGNWTWSWYDSDDVALSSGIFTVEDPTPPDDGDGDDPGDGDTDEVIDELQQSVQDLEEEIAQLSSDLEEALQTIEDISSSTAESMDEFEDTLDNTAEDAAESKQDAEEAKTLATEAKSVADQVKEDVDEAKSVAEEAKADAEEALKSSRGMTLMVYAALGISLVVAALNFIGPLQITRKLPR
jgi:acyl-CoA reductase-like NAD-dependent aldehyde dehydrogenase